MAKFDLERFKAGEPAIAIDGSKRFYVGMKRGNNSRVIVEFENGCVDHFDVEYAEGAWKMEEKELWTLYNQNRNVLSGAGVFNSREEALGVLDATELEDWEAVKIVRE